MELDQSALQSLIEANGNEVYTVSYDGGSPGHTGNAGVIHCLDSYWSYDDNGNLVARIMTSMRPCLIAILGLAKSIFP